jgi:hypothetical protein
MDVAAKEEPPSPPPSSPVKPVQSKPAWEVFLALLLAIVFYTTIHGDGDFKVRRYIYSVS